MINIIEVLNQHREYVLWAFLAAGGTAAGWWKARELVGTGSGSDVTKKADFNQMLNELQQDLAEVSSRVAVVESVQKGHAERFRVVTGVQASHDRRLGVLEQQAAVVQAVGERIEDAVMELGKKQQDILTSVAGIRAKLGQ